MGSRIIKESICTSEDINGLSPQAEILFYRLITKVDDYGCFYNNEKIIKSYCFPLKDDDEVSPVAVKRWLQELADAGIICIYTAQDGKQYLQFVKWHLHQSIRTQKHKFPTYECACSNLQQAETNCGDFTQVETDCNNLQQAETNCCLNPIQKESESKKNPNPNPNPNPKDAGRDYEKDDQFESFWNAYPKKSGDIRQAYMEYLHAISQGVTPERIIKAAHEQFDNIPPEDIQYMTSAERWLRNKGWEAPPRKEKKNGRKSSTVESVSGETSGSTPHSRWGPSEYRYDN